MATKTEKQERLVYTVPEAGALLNLGRSASYEAVRRKEIPVLKLGRRLVVPKAALARLLEGQGKDQAGKPA